MPIRILPEQNAPLGLRRSLAQYEIVPARRMGWAEIDNGTLIRAAQEAGFAIMITCDRNIRYQQNLTDWRIALIELTTGTWPVLRNQLDLVVEAIEAATPGS